MSEGPELRRRRLPHLTLKGSTYFVTWRLAEGASLLTAEEKEEVVSALKHFQDERYRLLAYVVMDDHVHVVVRPLAEHGLSDILHSWKSYTASKINMLRDSKGALWLDESFDRLIRNENELMQTLEYVITNPTQRWPEVKDYPWVGWFADG